MNKHLTFRQTFRAAIATTFLTVGVALAPAQEVSVPAAPANAETQDVLRAYLKVQEQLHALQLAHERSRQDAEDIAARNVKAISERLNLIESSLGTQRAAELQAMASNNRLMLIVVGALGVLVVFVIAFAYLQWRAMQRFTEAALGFTAQSQLGAGHIPKLIQDSEPRLISVIERLEKRILELEHGKHLSFPTGAAAIGNGTAENSAEAPPPSSMVELSNSVSQVTLLLNKGQSLLSLGQAEAAVACFDEVLAIEPANTEALIKKGSALEKLSKLNEAIVCYDRAIEVDHSVTLAYLYKGGVFNRLERYNEALACYEQALKTQEKAHAA